MLRRLGISGVLGVVVLLSGVGLVAYENLLIGTGIAMIVAGTGLVANGLIRQVMRQFGM